MKVNKFKACIITFSFILFLYPNNSIASSWFPTELEKKIEKSVPLSSINIAPQINKLSAGFGTSHSGEYYFIKSISKIFFQDKTIEVKVTGIEIDSKEILLTLNHDILGSGKIKFIFEDDYLKKTTFEELKTILLTTLSNKDYDYVLVNKTSKMYHLHTCNHLPPVDQLSRIKIGEANSLGFRSCGFCFTKMIYLPGIREEIQLSEEMMKHFSPFEGLLKDPQKQSYISGLGGEY